MESTSQRKKDNKIKKISGLIHPFHLDESISSFRDFWWMFSLLLYFAQKFLSANSVDPGQMPHFAASELDLHCLHIYPIMNFIFCRTPSPVTV